MGAGYSKSGPFTSCISKNYPAQAATDSAVDGWTGQSAAPREDEPLVKAQVQVRGAAPENKGNTSAAHQAEVKADALQQLLVDAASAEESPEEAAGPLADEPSSAQWVSWNTVMDPATKHR